MLLFGLNPWCIGSAHVKNLNGEELKNQDFEVKICEDYKKGKYALDDLQRHVGWTTYHRKTFKAAIELICRSIWFPPYKWFYKIYVTNRERNFFGLDRNNRPLY